MTGKQLREALREGRRVYGIQVTSPTSRWATSAVAKLNLDFVFIDMEHVPHDRREVAWMCDLYREMGLAPIVRIGSPDPYVACQVLDGGACGIIAPYVETVQEVKSLVGAVKYRPLKGKMLQEVLDGSRTLDPEVQKFLDNYNRDNVLMINVESVPAMENLDQLVAVPGLDALKVGPHDLSVSLGVPEQYKHPRVLEAIDVIRAKGRAAGLGVGVHYSEDIETHISWAKEGMNLIIYSEDTVGFQVKIAGDIATARQALGDTAGSQDDTPGGVHT